MVERVMTIQQLAEITGGSIIGDPHRQFSYLATDSRSLPGIDRVLFIAIRGDHHDGHLYIDELYSRGIRCFLADREEDRTRLNGASFCLVNDSMEA
ncbi:MAG: Mur ligase domain-containing protein, partial [Bacteroidales bacterium]|nr:Mur ligase domain-containing protein [Bacteroidales bacterium]